MDDDVKIGEERMSCEEMRERGGAHEAPLKEGILKEGRCE